MRKMANTRKTLLTFMRLTNKKNAILLKLWTYIQEKCANIGKKIENRMYIAREISKFTLFFKQNSYIKVSNINIYQKN